MKLSARARYAARILVDLAKNQGQAPLSASTLSKHTGVSVQFVEQILKPLKQHGLTMSIRGVAGGHCLAKPADDISFGEIIRAMEGGIYLAGCQGDLPKTCPLDKSSCLTREVWTHVAHVLENELNSISLGSVLKGDLQKRKVLSANQEEPVVKDSITTRLRRLGAKRGRKPILNRPSLKPREKIHQQRKLADE